MKRLSYGSLYKLLNDVKKQERRKIFAFKRTSQKFKGTSHLRSDSPDGQPQLLGSFLVFQTVHTTKRKHRFTLFRQTMKSAKKLILRGFAFIPRKRLFRCNLLLYPRQFVLLTLIVPELVQATVADRAVEITFQSALNYQVFLFIPESYK